MAYKKSSSTSSSLASRILRMDSIAGNDSFNGLLAYAKALAGSVLSQDETKGQARDEGDKL